MLPGIAHTTIVNFYAKLRDRVFEHIEGLKMDTFVDKSENIIEIDESVFGRKRKYNRGALTKHNSVWVFGLAQRGSRKTYFVPVTDRKKETLIPIIKSKVPQESMIYHDDWASYKDLENYGYSHDVVVHKEEFVSQSGVCTNTIEGERM